MFPAVLSLLALGGAPQAPRPPQAPPLQVVSARAERVPEVIQVRREPVPAPPRVTPSCCCSSACTCGCQEGLPCACATCPGVQVACTICPSPAPVVVPAAPVWHSPAPVWQPAPVSTPVWQPLPAAVYQTQAPLCQPAPVAYRAPAPPVWYPAPQQGLYRAPARHTAAMSYQSCSSCRGGG